MTMLHVRYAALLAGATLLCALAGGHAAAEGVDPLVQPVSARVLGEPLPRVLTALAPPNISLRVSKEFAETKCLLILYKVPLREAMDRLAQTFGGEWRQTQGAKNPEYVLSRQDAVV